jgi:site-specific recombinase XerD
MTSMSQDYRTRPAARAPKSYKLFIERARVIASERGLSWHIPHDEKGRVMPSEDWDLRNFSDSRARHASHLNGFRIDDTVRRKAISHGWSPSLLPHGEMLGEVIQDLLKAVAVHRATEGILPRSLRHEISLIRKFFSATNKFPWQLNSEDFDRYLDISGGSDTTKAKLIAFCSLINQNMLSLYVPLVVKSIGEHYALMDDMLASRKGGEKLPDVDALHELVRIVFQERPKGHQHAIRFAIARLLVLTGLRLNEIIMLPVDCLQWEDHVDVVTGKPAGEVGGISRSLRLKYFGEKRIKKGEKFLVADFQWIPARFEALVASTVNTILAATEPLRQALNSGSCSGRQFKTSAGTELQLADFLFLVLHRNSGKLPETIPSGSIVEMAAESSFIAFLGGSIRPGRHTVFTKYGNTPNRWSMSLKSHSLRHLMNTELFRSGVPDTVITQHFGRLSVVQSHVYDHRSLGERLQDIEIPTSATKHILPGTPQETVAKMVLSGLVGGSAISASFKKIQDEHGDEAAFEYLAKNSDGFHVTPYGFCITSFAINPCVRHLKCFDECRHYLPSGMQEHRISLTSLRDKLRVMRDAAAAKPLTSTGRKNQVAHAERLISGVESALASQPNVPLFKDGKDHSAPLKDLFR